ncbi:MAG TPA: fluoride efflux transporter CrcB [Thermohalobaculum sp.]|nr:fluoride efflux transporter CrcB [Thermohalobaculum sp.]
MPTVILAVAAGGAIGATLRWAVVRWAGQLLGLGFPYGTLIVNVLGSLIMGVAAVAMMERFPGSWGRFAPFLMTGVLGGFTTFSAFSLDALFLIERGRNLAAASYIGGSVLLSIGGLWLGLALARGVWGQ